MSGHEARINDALKQLGEEFRLGMVQADEYRARRRLLLESWGERDATTSPGSMRARAATTITNQNAASAAAAAAAASARPGKGAAVAVVVVLGIMIAAAGFLIFRSQQPAPAAGGSAPARAALPAAVQSAGKAADAFLAANSWEGPAIEAFLAQWRALSDADRATAAAQPSMRTLSYQLTQNIEAEKQLAGPDAAPEQRQRLTMLENFARELGTEGP